jgi:hypothetical protein
MNSPHNQAIRRTEDEAARANDLTKCVSLLTFFVTNK